MQGTNTASLDCLYCDSEIEWSDSQEFCSSGCKDSYETAEPRVKAFAEFEKCSIEDAEAAQTTYDEQRFEVGSREYLVVTDSEADELWDQDLDNYIDECILHELPEQYRGYFDDEAWKRDARFDGRAHSLNRYDGGEETADADGETFYIYRQN